MRLVETMTTPTEQPVFRDWENMQGWRAGSVVKSPCCSSRIQEIGFQHRSVQGISCPPLVFMDTPKHMEDTHTYTHGRYTYTHTHEIHTHTHMEDTHTLIHTWEIYTYTHTLIYAHTHTHGRYTLKHMEDTHLLKRSSSSLEPRQHSHMPTPLSLSSPNTPILSPLS